MQRIAVAGHSFGALTAIIKAGLTLQPGQYHFDESASDPRFRAVINMSGVGPMPMLTDDAFRHINVPLLATGGTEDEGNLGTGPVFPWEWRMSAYTDAAPGEKYSLVLQDADHYLGGLLGRHDRGGNADPDGLAIVYAVTTAFLAAQLRATPGALDWLKVDELAAATHGRATLKYT